MLKSWKQGTIKPFFYHRTPWSWSHSILSKISFDPLYITPSFSIPRDTYSDYFIEEEDKSFGTRIIKYSILAIVILAQFIAIIVTPIILLKQIEELTYEHDELR